MLSNQSPASSFLSTAAPPLLLTAILYTLQHSGTELAPHLGAGLTAREDQCRVDTSPQDACNSARKNCPGFDNDGLIPYFRIYYCTSIAARPYLLVGMFIWLMILFSSMASAAGDFLSVHLAIIVRMLNINESLAGVTTFAFGNGCTDLFSTLAAMKSDNGGLAISELFGAAAFITAVVLGLVAITRPFQVNPKSFVGDVVWFMVAATMLVAFLADGKLVIGECLGIVGLYVAFVCFALLRIRESNTSTTLTVTSESHHGDIRVENRAVQADNSSLTAIAERDSDTEPTTRLTPVEPEDGEAQESESSPLLEAENAQSIGDILQNDMSYRLAQPPREAWRSPLDMFPPFVSWTEQGLGEKVLTTLSSPLLLPIGLSTPVASALATSQTSNSIITPNSHESDNVLRSDQDATSPPAQPEQHSYIQWLRQHWVLSLQLILGPQFLAIVLAQQTLDLHLTSQNALIVCSSALIVSILYGVCFWAAHQYPDSHFSAINSLGISALAFAISLTWIYLIATSSVSLLVVLAYILDLPKAILGATIFAIGNSSNDLVADMVIARRGFPVLAASACLGGPMMNMLLGIGLGGLLQLIGSTKGVGRSGSDGYSFEVSRGLFVSAASLLVGLGVTLVYAFCNSWRLDRKLGVILIGVWVFFTAGTVWISISED